MIRSDKPVATALVLLVCVLQSSTAANSSVRIFKNCTELNKVYPGGVALPGAINSGGVTKKVPKHNKALYLANKKSD
jgi:hypothetical protein